MPSKWPFRCLNVLCNPTELDDAEAVSLLVNYNTMCFALVRRAAMWLGGTVLVLGAADGVDTTIAPAGFLDDDPQRHALGNPDE
jgi:hypothetical protein